MSQFRQDFITKEWVIVAPERAKRPDQFRQDVDRQEKLPVNDTKCPFCPGNEDKTPPPTMVVGEAKKWLLRVVPNKFAAVSPKSPLKRKETHNHLTAQGFGVAEVVIESPAHNTSLAGMSEDEVRGVLKVYKSRYEALAKNKDIDLITIFRNHGARAGTSLEHPHSQIIATPIVPPHVRYPMEQAQAYYDSFGKCPYCVTLEDELKQKERLILESDRFVCFTPFASAAPFEMRIMPRRHNSCFDHINDEELKDLANILRLTLKKLRKGLNNPDYNLVIRSSPISDGQLNYDHWRIVIIPRLTTPAGFELGTGIYIDIMKPEDAAAFLRGVEVN